MVIKDIIEELRHYSPNTKVFLRNSDFPDAKDVLADIIIAKQYPDGINNDGANQCALVIAGATGTVPLVKDNVKEADGGRILGDNYRLCYIDDGVMYFTDDFEHCWGDDWQDTNDCAGEPYLYNDKLSPEQNAERGASHLVYLGFRSNWQTTYPWKDKGYSIKDINKGEVAWICHDEVGGLLGGTPLPEAIGWMSRAGFFWGRLANESATGKLPNNSTAHWIERPHESGENWEYSMYECSDCHEWSDNDSNYCPNCGKEMK